MTTLYIIAAILILGMLMIISFTVMIFGAIKEARYYHEEALLMWDKDKEEIHIFFAHENQSVIKGVSSIEQVKSIMKDKGFKYVGEEIALMEG